MAGELFAMNPRLTSTEIALVDNATPADTLLNAIADCARTAASLDVATGHLDVGGILALRAKWPGVPLRILMGNGDVSLKTRQLFEQAISDLRREFDASIDAQKRTGNDFLDGVDALAGDLRDGRIVVRIYRPTRFHAKAYVARGRDTSVPVFVDQVDKDAVSLPVRSRYLFSLAALYDANRELLRERVEEDASQHELIATAVDYWKEVSKAMTAWGKVKIGDLKAMELRQNNLSSHATMLRAIGGIGSELLREHPSEWRAKVAQLAEVDWRKSNREWENVCIIAGSVVSNRQARQATKAFLKRRLGLTLSPAESSCLGEFAGAMADE